MLTRRNDRVDDPRYVRAPKAKAGPLADISILMHEAIVEKDGNIAPENQIKYLCRSTAGGEKPRNKNVGIKDNSHSSGARIARDTDFLVNLFRGKPVRAAVRRFLTDARER